VTLDDLLEFGLDGEPIEPDGPTPYAERYIHAAIYEARPDVQSVVHNHAYDVIPFGVTGVPLRPIFHIAARMGGEIPVWDIAEKFGHTNMLVVNLDQGRDLATSLGDNRVVLMRGHGCAVAGESIYAAVSSSIYTQVNARLQMMAMQMGDVTYLAPGEIEAHQTSTYGGTAGRNRAWEYLRRRAGCEDL
jgi:HCOMODA/2-hydroxy-3-carboxy-muconic semialdehyde decarboxylase